MRRDWPAEAPVLAACGIRDGGAAVFEGPKALGPSRTRPRRHHGPQVGCFGERGGWRAEEGLGGGWKLLCPAARGGGANPRRHLEGSDPAEQRSRCWEGGKKGLLWGAKPGGFFFFIKPTAGWLPLPQASAKKAGC